MRSLPIVKVGEIPLNFIFLSQVLMSKIIILLLIHNSKVFSSSTAFVLLTASVSALSAFFFQVSYILIHGTELLINWHDIFH